jgi:hypothetical protein
METEHGKPVWRIYRPTLKRRGLAARLRIARKSLRITNVLEFCFGRARIATLAETL